jgi:hypothetical protein
MTNEQKDKPTFDFKKIDEDHYAFVMKSKDIERTEVVHKQYVKDHYKTIKEEKAEHMRGLSQVQKDIARAEFVKDAELDHFLELANKAADYAKGVKAMEQRDFHTDMIGKLSTSIEQIEKVLPEVKRMSEQ